MAEPQFNFSGLTPITADGVQPPPQNVPPEGGVNFSGLQVLNPQVAREAQQEEKYGSLPQQALTVVEGLGKGFAGPIATGAEALLSKAGVPGLTPEDQAARAEVNPTEHLVSEIGGFGAGAFTGTGEAALLGKVGEAAVGGLGLAGATGTIAKIAATGVKAGAELAALQTGEEASKFINQDPNQTLGSAAINVGLSGLIGGAGGVALGGVSELFKTAANKLKIAKVINDFQGETKFLQEGADVAEGAKSELQDRVQSLNEIAALGEKPKKIMFTTIESKDPIQKVIDKASGVIQNANKEYLPEIEKAIGDPESLSKSPLKKYLNVTQKAVDSIKEIHIENDLPLPPAIELNPTPALERALGGKTEDSVGRQLAQWAHAKGSEALAKTFGETVGGGVGAAIGAIVGHPFVGAYVGERFLSPTLSSLAKPFAETAVDSEAVRASMDYLLNAVKGDATLSEAVKGIFKSGEVLPKHLLPTQTSRDKVEKSLNALSIPQNAMQVGGKIGHYLPDHGTAAAFLAAQAKNYFDALKPRQPQLGPLDSPMPIDKTAEANYNRQLNIAQQPLLVLKHVKDGTLLPQDVATLNTLYPGLHKSMIEKLQTEIIDRKAAGDPIPYSQRVSLSRLMGSPLDFTQTPQAAQAIMMSSGPTEQQAKGRPNGKASGAELSQINKVNALTATKSQAIEARQRKV